MKHDGIMKFFYKVILEWYDNFSLIRLENSFVIYWNKWNHYWYLKIILKIMKILNFELIKILKDLILEKKKVILNI